MPTVVENLTNYINNCYGLLYNNLMSVSSH